MLFRARDVETRVTAANARSQNANACDFSGTHDHKHFVEALL